MALSFSPVAPSGEVQPARPARVLITGAGGALGAQASSRLAARYRLRLMIMPGADAGDLGRHGEVVACDLADHAGVQRACQDIDTVLHLAGTADPSATWDALLANNIVGAYHLFTAAKAAGCRRVVYASSIHAVSGYPTEVQVKATEPVNPGDLYGVSKCFGEALGRYLAEQEGLSVIAIRLGACLEPAQAADQDAVGVMDTFLAIDDLIDLLVLAIDDRRLRWALLHAVSDNRFKRLDISDARDLLGFAPRSDAFRLQRDLSGIDFARRVLAHNLGDERQRSGLRDHLTGPAMD